MVGFYALQTKLCIHGPQIAVVRNINAPVKLVDVEGVPGRRRVCVIKREHMAELRQAAACLRIFGDDIVPGEISEAFGVAPSKAWKKGELWSNNGQGQLRQSGGWILNSRWDTFDSLNDQIADLLQQVTQDRHVWFETTGRFHVDMFCGLFLDTQSGSSTLCPDTLAQLGARKIVLSFDIYEREARLRSSTSALHP